MAENKTRVWQWIDITFEPEEKALNENRTIIAVRKPPIMCTFSRQKDGTLSAELKLVKPNAAFQYVIKSNESFYDEQCRSMAGAETDHYKGKIVEITNEPDFKIGLIPKKYRPVPPKSVNEAALENEVAKLRAELEKVKEKR